jgi:hypothetical protein
MAILLHNEKVLLESLLALPWVKWTMWSHGGLLAIRGSILTKSVYEFLERVLVGLIIDLEGKSSFKTSSFHVAQVFRKCNVYAR